MELALTDYSPSFLFFCSSAENKLMTDKMQNIFNLITEHSGITKYTLNRLGYKKNIMD